MKQDSLGSVINNIAHTNIGVLTLKANKLNIIDIWFLALVVALKKTCVG